MKQWMVFCLSAMVMYGVEFKNEIDFSGIGYNKRHSEVLLSGNSEMTYKREGLEAKVRLGYLYSSEYAKRRYLYLNELYVTKDIGSYRIDAGKRILYWGELEGYNITDIFNTKNYLKDPFEKAAKLGSWSVSLSHYEGEKVIEAGVKFYEERQEFGDVQTPYYPLPLPYDPLLKTQQSRYTPTLYISYAWSSDAIMESESRVLLWHGYDAKRDFLPADADRLFQYAYRVNKLLLLSHLVYRDTIFKFEGSYTNVIDYLPMSDYWQIGIGTEQSLYDLGGMDLTIYGEYYAYGYRNRQGHEQVDISEIYNDDLFLAFKLDVNDAGSSEVKAGILYDLGNKEKVFKVQARTRVMDRFVVYAEVLRLFPAGDTLLDRFDNHTRMTVGVNYTF